MSGKLSEAGLADLPPDELREWAVITDHDWTADQEQTGKHKVQLVPLRDGPFICNANLLTEENGLFPQLAELDVEVVQCVFLDVARGLMRDRKSDDIEDGPQWPQWRQVEAAGLGPRGAEDGWPVGARVVRDGLVWVSRQPNNVNAPLTDDATTWSRADGFYVTPAGWEYQPGEEVTEDGETWYRVEQATSFPPSASPSQYTELGDGDGADDSYPEWQQPTGGHDAYAAGDRVRFDAADYESLIDANVWSPTAHPQGWVKL